MARIAISLLIFLNVHLGMSDELYCEYKMLNVLNIETMTDVYSCKGVIVSRAEGEITSISGIHMNTNKNDEDVIGLQVNGQDLKTYLRNVEKRFPNLEQINLSYNEITELTNEDLLLHKNLTHFMINENMISSLNDNIFDDLPELKQFYLNNNNLMHVQHDIRLPTTTSFYFANNTCIHQNATSYEEIEQLLLDFLVKCPPTMLQMEESIAIRENLFTDLEKRNFILKNRLHFLEEHNRKILEVLKEA